MMVKLRNILFCLLAVAAAATAKADNYAHLTVGSVDGQVSFEVSNIQKITFDATDMILNMADGRTQRLPLATLSKMSFSATATDIATVKETGQGLISLRDNLLTVKNRGGAVVTLYDVKGVAVKSVSSREDETEISLSGLPKGVYIIKVGSVARKVMNR